jgi:hypothetical protein
VFRAFPTVFVQIGGARGGAILSLWLAHISPTAVGTVPLYYGALVGNGMVEGLDLLSGYLRLRPAAMVAEVPCNLTPRRPSSQVVDNLPHYRC